MMKKYLLCTVILVLCTASASAVDMNSAYDQATAFATSQQNAPVQAAQNPNYSQIPGYQGTNVPQVGYKGDLTLQARQALRDHQSQTGNFIQNSIVKNPVIKPSQQLLNQAESIQAQASNTMAGKMYCADDSCVDTSYTPESQQEFAQKVSAISGLSQATLEAGYDKLLDQMQTFKGNNLKCRDVMLNYDNCCADSGWGKIIGLAGCNSEEKTLGTSKQEGLCVYIGEYCSHHTPITHICTEHKKSYCCFASVLAKVIQQQGRPQLGWNFGAPDVANCKGFTPAEMQRIDFSTIDFTEFYQTLAQKMHMPDQATMDAQLKADLEQMYKNRKPV